MNNTIRSLMLVLCSVFAISALAIGTASAAENPFSVPQSSGTQLAAEGAKCSAGKCQAGKCTGAPEQKCEAGKCQTGKCQGAPGGSSGEKKCTGGASGGEKKCSAGN